MENKDLKFEDAMKKLEEIVEQIEGNVDDLDEVIKLYNQGIELVELCRNKLDNVESEVEILTKKMNERLGVKQDPNEKKV